VSATIDTQQISTALTMGKLKKKARKSANMFDKLNDEVILKIFANLSSDELCRSCSRVCRRWYYLSWDPYLWQCVSFSDPNLNIDRGLKAVLRLLSRDVYCRQRPSLMLDERDHYLTSSSLKSTGSGQITLPVEVLRVEDSFTLTDRGLVLVARKCSDLKVLQVRGCANISDSGLTEIMSNCTQLEKLDLTGCANITLDCNQEQINECESRLNYFDITDCHQVDDHSIKKFLKHHGSQISHFYSRRCSLLTDNGIKSVARYCPLLKEVSLNDCSQLTDYSCFELSSKLGQSLRYLSLAKCVQISDVGLKQVARFCYKLRYLNVRGCEAVSDQGLACIARSSGPRLKALDVGKCDRITDEGLKAISESCPNLRKLGLRECDLVSDTGLSLVAYYCRLLTHLNIADCPYVSQEGYRYVKRFCKRCVIQHTDPNFY
jgi:F-box/leucine-rich repeat protein 7